jgi:DNA-binding FrmR family transcriptional regulator
LGNARIAIIDIYTKGKNMTANDHENHTHPHHHHQHSEKEKKAIMNRLSKAIGHLQSVRTMVENNRDCSEVLIQLSAVKSAINNTGKEILKQHISECIVEAVEHGDVESIQQLNRAIDTFMK